MAKTVTKEELVKMMDSRGYLDPDNADAYYDALIELPKKGSLLEIGTGRGDSATFFALAKPNWIIYSIDSYQVASDYIGAYGLTDLGGFVRGWRGRGITNILPVIANSFNVPWEIMVDAIYIDGDHRYEAVKSDFERFIPFLKEGGIVMMDDYGRHNEGRFEVGEYVNNELKGYWDIQPVGSGVILRRKT